MNNFSQISFDHFGCKHEDDEQYGCYKFNKYIQYYLHFR